MDAGGPVCGAGRVCGGRFGEGCGQEVVQGWNGVGGLKVIEDGFAGLWREGVGTQEGGAWLLVVGVARIGGIRY